MMVDGRCNYYWRMVDGAWVMVDEGEERLGREERLGEERLGKVMPSGCTSFSIYYYAACLQLCQS